MHPLEGSRVVLTGAAGGIGSLVAAKLRAAGAHVIGVDRDAVPHCDEAFTTDLSSEGKLASLCERLAEDSCDVLVNLAGVQYFGPFTQQPASALWRDFAVNLIAPVMLTRAVLPGMIGRGRGRIVNIGSVLGAIPFAHFATYSSSKGGLKAFSEALRRELAGSGVDVTHVSPRAVRTPLCSEKVLAFAAATNMAMDAPEMVAERIVAAIAGGERDVVIGRAERWFARINALAPRLIDRALAAGDRKAAALFSPAPMEKKDSLECE